MIVGIFKLQLATFNRDMNKALNEPKWGLL